MAASVAGDLAVRRFEPGDRELWEDLVARSRSRHFLFRREYMEYHRDRFEDASMIVLDGGAPVAALPASRDGDSLVSHGGLTFGGLISTPSLTARRTVEALAMVFAAAAEDGNRRLVYKAVPAIYHLVPAEEELYALFALEASLVRRDCSAALRPCRPLPYSKGRRAAIRRGQKAGFEIGRDDAVAEFMELEDEALQRRHGVAPVHTPAEMTMLARSFPENIKLFSARRAGELIAGVLIYETDAVAHAQYIAGTERGYAEHALDAIIDFLIRVEYADKPWFDFGISTTDAGRSLNHGLIRNKESFGARAVVYDTYEIELGARDAVD